MASPLRIIQQQSFACFEEFRECAKQVRLLFFHVYTGQPDPLVFEALSTWSPNEALLLMDVDEDRGFLRNTIAPSSITKDKTAPSRPLIELRGLGAWADRSIVGFTEIPDLFDHIVRQGREAISTKVDTMPAHALKPLQTMQVKRPKGKRRKQVEEPGKLIE